MASVKQMMGHGSFIGDDLLLFESLTKLPWPNSPRRMKCVLLAMCMKGKAQYSVDTEEHMVKGGDVIIINEGAVVDNYMFSTDFDGIAIMMGYDFFSDVIKGIHELSSLFLFSRMHPVFSLTKEEQFAIQAYFRAIKYRVDDTGHHFRIDVVRSLIMTMIYDISNAIYRLQQTNDHRQTRAEAIFAKFIKLVEENFRQERRVSWYGEKLQRVDRQLRHPRSARTAEKQHDEHQTDFTAPEFPEPEFPWQILQGTRRHVTVGVPAILTVNNYQLATSLRNLMRTRRISSSLYSSPSSSMAAFRLSVSLSLK